MTYKELANIIVELGKNILSDPDINDDLEIVHDGPLYHFFAKITEAIKEKKSFDTTDFDEEDIKRTIN